MLEIIIPGIEFYDEAKDLFVSTKEQTLHLEHSLVSLSKWESKWHKAFLAKGEKTIKETIDYIRCMNITQNVKDDVFNYVSKENIDQVRKYIDEEMTATTFPNEKKTLNRDVITAEIIYHWMIVLNIPFDCQKWHLNRLLTLINVCNIKNQPPKKMNAKEVMRRNKELNDLRRQSMNSRG